MYSPPVIVDGLWRCLCPSYSRIVVPLKQSRILSPERHPTTHVFRRSFQHAASQAEPPSRPAKVTRSKRRPFPVVDAENRKPETLDIPALYEKLRSATSKDPQTVEQIVKILVHDRHEKPNSRIYSALLRSCASPGVSSAALLRKLIRDLKEEGIEFDAALCHDALEALAVHPDYLLLDEILEHMRERWYTLSEWGHNLVAASLLRSRQFELALFRMDKMKAQGIRVYVWLQNMAYYVLAEQMNVEEAFKILQDRAASDLAVSDMMWHHALDTASRNLHVC
jgi:hypothetical protein